VRRIRRDAHVRVAHLVTRLSSRLQAAIPAARVRTGCGPGDPHDCFRRFVTAARVGRVFAADWFARGSLQPVTLMTSFTRRRRTLGHARADRSPRRCLAIRHRQCADGVTGGEYVACAWPLIWPTVAQRESSSASASAAAAADPRAAPLRSLSHECRIER
jgi:hypothetical protein